MMNAEPATILASEIRSIVSEHTGRTYRITIALPYAYSKSGSEDGPFGDAPSTWHVVYLLDANWYFGMVTDIVRSMAWCGGTTDAIVVGIGYPEAEDAQETWLETFARRNMDFTFVRDEAREKELEALTKRPVVTGKAGDFHLFIRDELIPLIEQEYRADPSKRILAGHSRAGNFATFALFKEPDLFNAYVIGSAGPGDNDRFLFKEEEAFAKANKKLPAKVYLSAGELEEGEENTTLTDTLRFAAILASRNYEDLNLVKHVFAERSHCEVIAPGFQAGLMFALKK
jgi:predicted alpha/beta superfamily hydrolase